VQNSVKNWYTYKINVLNIIWKTPNTNLFRIIFTELRIVRSFNQLWDPYQSEFESDYGLRMIRSRSWKSQLCTGLSKHNNALCVRCQTLSKPIFMKLMINKNSTTIICSQHLFISLYISWTIRVKQLYVVYKNRKSGPESSDRSGSALVW